MDKLLNLPWQIQLALGSGYMAYLIAYSGIRQHHTTTDVVFRSFSFGLIATAVMVWKPIEPAWLVVCFAGLATILTGAAWRWRGMPWAKALLGTTNISWTDDIPTAWLSITAMRTDTRPSQIAVDLENGRTLVCDDTRRFAQAPFGPCVFGLDGSIAFYVTAELRPDGTWIEKSDVEDNYDGPRITYVPAASIKRVELRLWTNANATASTEEEPVAGGVEVESAASAESS